ncbi:hypothetical protein BDK51DRAFT_42787 [Blyttiomyces helicus]|uniref:SH3 domain-containing protein n=1 Tax=Blyttiomyces helicus TaxID=388810 RepID=A0A4P9WLH4_9FUNG|nr:hypothetical protein BDK51DRAFT_42787 [Blyttiomyces helicus]|eukprot:RKO91980.1 hypothetical protein BDK51DRAFT_42787 [Blyttiomyces helicus]
MKDSSSLLAAPRTSSMADVNSSWASSYCNATVQLSGEDAFDLGLPIRDLTWEQCLQQCCLSESPTPIGATSHGCLYTSFELCESLPPTTCLFALWNNGFCNLIQVPTSKTIRTRLAKSAVYLSFITPRCVSVRQWPRLFQCTTDYPPPTTVTFRSPSSSSTSTSTPSTASSSSPSSSLSSKVVVAVAATCGILAALIVVYLLMRYRRSKSVPASSHVVDTFHASRPTSEPAYISAVNAFMLPPDYASVPGVNPNPTVSTTDHRPLPHENAPALADSAAVSKTALVTVAVARATRTLKQADELPISVGDEVVVEEVLANGWAKGQLVKDGRVGVFPYAVVVHLP